MDLFALWVAFIVLMNKSVCYAICLLSDLDRFSGECLSETLTCHHSFLFFEHQQRSFSLAAPLRRVATKLFPALVIGISQVH